MKGGQRSAIIEYRIIRAPYRGAVCGIEIDFGQARAVMEYIIY
jgi:hypothetical protein